MWNIKFALTEETEKDEFLNTIIPAGTTVSVEYIWAYHNLAGNDAPSIPTDITLKWPDCDANYGFALQALSATAEAVVQAQGFKQPRDYVVEGAVKNKRRGTVKFLLGT